jgi:transcriptional repressor NrdR
MYCPKCGHEDTKVLDTRMGGNGRSIRRRRQCLACEYRFTTVEEIVREDIVVVKRDGIREDFDRGKIYSGVRKAAEKRPIATELIDALVSGVVDDVQGKCEPEISSRDIGEIVMNRLRDLDHIAYVRFASVYREFRDIDELAKMINQLKRSKS